MELVTPETASRYISYTGINGETRFAEYSPECLANHLHQVSGFMAACGAANDEAGLAVWFKAFDRLAHAMQCAMRDRERI